MPTTDVAEFQRAPDLLTEGRVAGPDRHVCLERMREIDQIHAVDSVEENVNRMPIV